MGEDYKIVDEWIAVEDPKSEYFGSDSLNELTYKIIGICFAVHNELGNGFLEVVYKDAIEYELKAHNIPFNREKKYEIKYKDIVLKHSFFADFIVDNRVILEVKAQPGAAEANVKQTINYLAVSDCQIGLLVNFGEKSLKYKQIIF